MQDVGEILVGIESVFLCRDDEGVEDGTGLCPRNGLREEPVFSSESEGSNLIFDKVGIESNIPELEHEQELAPLTEGIGDGLSCKQRSGCFMNVIVEPSLERLDE